MTKRKAKPVKEEHFYCWWSIRVLVLALMVLLAVDVAVLFDYQDKLYFAQSETTFAKDQIIDYRIKSEEANERWDDFVRRKATRAPGGRVRVEGYLLVHSTVETTGLRYYNDLSGRRWVTRE